MAAVLAQPRHLGRGRVQATADSHARSLFPDSDITARANPAPKNGACARPQVSTKPGASTVTLVTDGYIKEITRDELQPGDLIGHCGPGTGESGGHVVLFDHWADGHATYWAYEQHGGHHPEPFGPEHSVVTYPYHGLEGYKPYRYVGIQDGPGPHVPAGGNGHGHFVSVTAWPDRLSTVAGIAAAAGIADWHKIWDDPENAGLRAHRVVAEHVQPGDAVWVPAP